MDPGARILELLDLLDHNINVRVKFDIHDDCLIFYKFDITYVWHRDEIVALVTVLLEKLILGWDPVILGKVLNLGTMCTCGHSNRHL
jgi:hypothetical protein